MEGHSARFAGHPNMPQSPHGRKTIVTSSSANGMLDGARRLAYYTAFLQHADRRSVRSRVSISQLHLMRSEPDMARKAFTVEEANIMLPELEEILVSIDSKKGEIAEDVKQLQILDALWGESVAAENNPDHAEFLAHRNKVSATYEAIEEVVHTELLGRGLRFPAGGLEHGLLDFPSTFNGRWVYLCWQRGEDRVGFWHEIDGGYGGRREISGLESAVMGTEFPPPNDSSLDL